MKFPFDKRRRRRYPIRRDRSGRSLRQQAFELFDAGSRPSDIYNGELVQASPRTLFRYYEDWKRENNRPSPSMLKKATTRYPELTETRAMELSEQLGMPVAEVVAWAQQPWGLIQLLGEQLYGNPMEAVGALVAEIILLKDNSQMEIRKQRGTISVTTKYSDGRVRRMGLRINTPGQRR